MPPRRREFLQAMAAAGHGDADGRRAAAAARDDDTARRSSIRVAKADACILLWMAGGMAAPETFDPKRYQPFEVGLPVEKVMSTFPAIDTVVDNIKISQGLENIAKVMDRGTLIRSHVLPDLGHILHSRHQYHWHTGYVPPQTVAAPHIGAWMARVLGPRQPGDAAVHQHRPAAGRARRIGGDEGVHHRRLFRHRVRPVQPAVPGRRDAGRAPAEGNGRRPVRESLPPVSRSSSSEARRRSTPATTSRSRCCASIDAAHRLLSSKEKQRVRSVAGDEGRRSTSTTRAASAAAACSRGGWSKPGRGSSK